LVVYFKFGCKLSSNWSLQFLVLYDSESKKLLRMD
jgi:hypothetical protein